MVRSLLEEGFQSKAHGEMKEVPVYELGNARAVEESPITGSERISVWAAPRLSFPEKPMEIARCSKIFEWAPLRRSPDAVCLWRFASIIAAACGLLA